MKRKMIYTIFIVIITGVLLILLYYYYQPACAPCPSDIECPPCYSKQQILIKKIWFLPIIIGTVYFIVSLLKKRRE